MKYEIGRTIRLNQPIESKITGATVSQKGAVSYQTSAGKSYSEELLEKLFDIEPLTAAEGKPPEKHTYKVGDLVEFISVPGGSDVRAGHIGQIVSLEDMVEYYQVKDLNTSKTWYPYGSNFKPYAPAVREVKRPAKVGEWVKVVDARGTRGAYANEDIVCVSELGVGGIYILLKYGRNSNCVSHIPPSSYLSDSEYVVLENYVPEKQEKPVEEEPKYWSGKVVCVDNYGNTTAYTVGKVYSIVDGFLTDNRGDKTNSQHPCASFDDWSKWTASKFIEYKGEN